MEVVIFVKDLGQGRPKPHSKDSTRKSYSWKLILPKNIPFWESYPPKTRGSIITIYINIYLI